MPSATRIAEFKDGILGWYRDHRRDFYWRSEKVCNYTKVVSEVLLQRTQAGTVSRFLPTFLAVYPDWQAIAGSDEDAIGDVLRPLGLWRRRAGALLSLSREITGRTGAWPSTREELESMPAVGQYVASAVLMFEHGMPAPLMDASMARVLRRYFGLTPIKADIRYDRLLQATADAVVDNTDAVIVNWAILDFAALQCKKLVPACESCPLQRGCACFLGAAAG